VGDRGEGAPLQCAWRLQVSDPGRLSEESALSSRLGDIDQGLDAWSCSHAVNEVAATTGEPAEAGSIVCDSGEGVTFATSIACSPTLDDPRVCQAGSLRFTDGDSGVRALMITTKDAANPGCF
jgi:hypothetical protein